MKGDAGVGGQDKDADVEVIFFHDAEVMDLRGIGRGGLEVGVHGRNHPQVVELDLGVGREGGRVGGRGGRREGGQE